MLMDFFRKCKALMLSGEMDKAYHHMMNYSTKRPLDINIETTTICPMKCKFCCNRIFPRDKVVMPVNMFQSIVKEYISMGGGTLGVSSMQSDCFADPFIEERFHIIADYKEFLWVHTTTPLITAARLPDERLLHILSNLDFLEISVGGYDQESYLNLCGVNAFDVLMVQLRRIKKIIQEYHLHIDVAMAFRTYDKDKLVSSNTYKELTTMFRDGGIIDNFFSWFGSIKLSDLPAGAKLRVSDNSNKVEDCVVPNATLAIQANGNVVGCGCIDWLNSVIIGNVHTTPLLDIWNSSEAVAFRKAFSSKHSIPAICQECGLYSSVAIFRNTCFKNYNSRQGLYYVVGNQPSENFLTRIRKCLG